MHQIKFIKFGFISGFGLVVDLLIYSILIKYNLHIIYSNAISSSCATISVYIISSILVFNKIDGGIIKIFLWILYQILNIILFSNVVYFFNIYCTSPIVSKLLTIPISFICNYIVISMLLNR